MIDLWWSWLITVDFQSSWVISKDLIQTNTHTFKHYSVNIVQVSGRTKLYDFLFVYLLLALRPDNIFSLLMQTGPAIFQPLNQRQCLVFMLNVYTQKLESFFGLFGHLDHLNHYKLIPMLRIYVYMHRCAKHINTFHPSWMYFNKM